MGFNDDVASQQFWEANVRFGPNADIGAGSGNVRFTPKSRHWLSVRFVSKALMHRSNQCQVYARYCLIFASSWRGLKGFGT